MTRLHDILDAIVAYNPEADLEIIKRAYVFAAKAHQGQVRRSGEPYMVHPMEVAGILVGMRMDVPSIATGLLHDTVEDTVATLEEIERLFGSEVSSLVDGVTKLSKIKFNTSEERQAENFRKMIMAMANDIRVIMVKLADRVHNMRTLSHLREDRRIAIAQETLDIYAPIANRLGIQQFKVELEDLCLKYLKPSVYELLDKQLHARRGELNQQIKHVSNIVRDLLEEQKIAAEISSRVKHAYSVYRKMENQNIPFEDVHDLVAFRIIVDTVQQCYETLGVLHNQWRPVPGRFKDYIAMPKGNNYQSLHTTVIGDDGYRMEFQIRTHEMHEFAEHGIAAHWKYKEGRLIEDRDEMRFKWIRRLLEWQKELSDPTEFLDTVKLDLFADDVYVFTPKGQLREFPRGATPVDFAYSIHSDVGHRCVGAKVNGKIVPLRYTLRSGDTVEIITQKNAHPNKDWLQFARTSRAKAKVRQYLRQQEHDESAAIGRSLLEKACRRVGVSINSVLTHPSVIAFARDASYENAEALLIPIGYGKMTPQYLIQMAFPQQTSDSEESLSPETAQAAGGSSMLGGLMRRLSPKSGSLVKVGGLSNMLVGFGKCCNPVVGDPIVGYVTRGRGVTVHTVDCPRVIGMDPERRIGVEWDNNANITRVARIRVVCANKPGMLASMTEAITSQGANISAASIHSNEDQTATNLFDIDIKNIAQLRGVISALEKLKGVISVVRFKG